MITYKGQICPILKKDFLWGQNLCQIKYAEKFPTIGGGQITVNKTIWINVD